MAGLHQGIIKPQKNGYMILTVKKDIEKYESILSNNIKSLFVEKAKYG